MEKLMTPDEVAVILAVKVATIYDWIHKKKISYQKVGRLVRFRNADLDAFIQPRNACNTAPAVQSKTSAVKRSKRHKNPNISEIVARAKTEVFAPSDNVTITRVFAGSESLVSQ